MRKENGVLYDVTEEDIVLLEKDPKTFWEGIKVIGAGAFLRCISLKSITIPKSVEKIGYDAFYSCSNLESITIAGNNTKIEEGAFADCRNLKEIRVPNGFKLRKNKGIFGIKYGRILTKQLSAKELGIKIVECGDTKSNTVENEL